TLVATRTRAGWPLTALERAQWEIRSNWYGSNESSLPARWWQACMPAPGFLPGEKRDSLVPTRPVVAAFVADTVLYSMVVMMLGWSVAALLARVARRRPRPVAATAIIAAVRGAHPCDGSPAHSPLQS